VNITGIVVLSRPARSEDIRRALGEIPGVEVHTVTPEGRMVVTVERDDDLEARAAMDAIARTDGVLSLALAFHHDEEVTDP
jgi:nitrate reductase NapD